MTGLGDAFETFEKIVIFTRLDIFVFLLCGFEWQWVFIVVGVCKLDAGRMVIFCRWMINMIMKVVTGE